MFIASTKDGNKFVENSSFNGRPFTWEDIPGDVCITALALTHPIPFGAQHISPKVSIKKYHYYYFFNEAIISIMRSETGGPAENATIVAKVMAGVDVDKEYVMEVRLDKYGNTSINTYPLKTLVHKLDNGYMRRTMLRPGIDCAPEKKLL